MSMAQYASAVSKTSSVAVQYHDTMEDMNAIMATLTSNGIKNANIAGTDYNNLLKVLNGNTKSVAEKSHALNPAFNENAFAAMDVAHKVSYLNSMIVTHGHNIAEVIGKQQNAAAAFTVLSQHAGDYATNLKNLSNQQKNAATTEQEWKTTSEGFTVTMSRVQAAANILMISLGEKLLPVLGKLLDKVEPMIEQLTIWADKNHVVDKAIAGVTAAITFSGNAISTATILVTNAINGTIRAIQDIVHWYQAWKGPIDTVAITLTVFFTPALIKAGIEALISGVKIATGFITSVVMTGVQAIISGVKVTIGFVASMITAGATAWVQGPRIIASFVVSMVTSGTQAVVSGAKITASFVVSMVTAGTQAVVSAARVAGSFVASMVMTGVQAVIAAAKVVGSFVASLVVTGARAIATAAIITGQFVASLVMAGIRAALTGGVMLASLIPAIVATAASALAAAVTAIPALVVAFAAWAVGAGAAAIATIAATWPILLIIAAVALLVVGIVLLVTHWSQVSAWLQGAWSATATFAAGIWNSIANSVQSGFGRAIGFVQSIWAQISAIFTNAAGQAVQFGANIIQGLINGIMSMIGAVANTASAIMTTIKHFIGARSPTEKGPGRDLHLWGPALVTTFSNDIQSTAPKARIAAENMMIQLAGAIKKYPDEISKAVASGDRVQESSLKNQLSNARTQMDIYKGIVKEGGYTYDQYNLKTPINFSGRNLSKNAKYSADGTTPVYGSSSSASTSSLSTGTLGTSTSSSGGNTYITMNNNFNLPKGTSIITAKEIVDLVDKQLATKLRRQANLTTTSSGGMSA